MKRMSIILALCVCSALAEDLSKLYEKAYFLETAKGQTEEALKIYNRIVATDDAEANRQLIIQSLERMLILHQRERDGTLQDKVDHFNLYPDVVDRVVAVFGEPETYINGNNICSPANLPPSYTMIYPGGFSVNIMSDKVHELRFKEPNIEIQGIRVGTPLERVVELLPPKMTITEPVEVAAMRTEKGTIYMNYGIEGTASYVTDKGIRLFFANGTVHSMALFNPQWPRPYKHP